MAGEIEKPDYISWISKKSVLNFGEPTERRYWYEIEVILGGVHLFFEVDQNKLRLRQDQYTKRYYITPDYWMSLGNLRGGMNFGDIESWIKSFRSKILTCIEEVKKFPGLRVPIKHASDVYYLLREGGVAGIDEDMINGVSSGGLGLSNGSYDWRGYIGMAASGGGIEIDSIIVSVDKNLQEFLDYWGKDPLKNLYKANLEYKIKMDSLKKDLSERFGLDEKYIVDGTIMPDLTLNPSKRYPEFYKFNDKFK